MKEAEEYYKKIEDLQHRQTIQHDGVFCSLDYTLELMESYHQSRMDSVMDELSKELENYNDWLVNVWYKELYIPFQLDAPTAYLKFKQKQKDERSGKDR